jgi:hypothetical protein
MLKFHIRIAKTDIQLSISSKSHLSKDILKVIVYDLWYIQNVAEIGEKKFHKYTV